MLIKNIIKNLTDKNVLTSKDIQTLESQTFNKNFLVALLNIYENRINTYLESCAFKVKRALLAENVLEKDVLEATAMQHMFNATWSTVFATNKMALLPMLILMLREASSELLVSLGMVAFHKTESDVVHLLKPQALQVFKSYLARYQLFKEIGQADLQQLCLEVHTESPTLFPVYLLQAFAMESQLEKLLENLLTSQTTNDVTQLTAQILVEIIKQQPEFVSQCLHNLIFYIETILKESVIEATSQILFFAHLESDEKLSQFINALCSGCMAKLNTEEGFVKISAANTTILESKFSQICLPALSLLGMPVAVGMNDIAAQKQYLEQQITAIAVNKTTINQAADTLKTERLNQINKWLADFQPQWTVGFGSPVETPGAILKF